MQHREAQAGEGAPLAFGIRLFLVLCSGSGVGFGKIVLLLLLLLSGSRLVLRGFDGVSSSDFLRHL